MLEILEEQPTESDFDQICRHAQSLLQENLSTIRALLVEFAEATAAPKEKDKSDEKAKQSNYECIVCSRKFVHDSGLYRHYDKHFGEIIKKSPPASNTLHPVVLCVFCGETTTKESDAWKHFTQVHLEVEQGEQMICFFSDQFQFGLNDVKTEPCSQPPLAKKQKLNVLGQSSNVKKSEKIRVPARDFPVNEFIRIVHVSKLYHCEFCDSTFANSKSLLSHASTHEPTAYFSCKLCDLKALSLKDILLHRYAECWHYRDFRNPLREIPRIWICNVCDEEFLGLEDLILHR